MSHRNVLRGCCIAFPCECLPVYDFISDRVRLKLLSSFFLVGLLLNFYQIATSNFLQNYIVISVYLIVFGPFLFSNTLNSNKVSIIVFCFFSLLYHTGSFAVHIFSVVTKIRGYKTEANISSIFLFEGNFTRNATIVLQEPFYSVAINVQQSMLDLSILICTIILFFLTVWKRGENLLDYHRKVRNYKVLAGRILSYDSSYTGRDHRILNDYIRSPDEQDSLISIYFLTIKNYILSLIQTVYRKRVD